MPITDFTYVAVLDALDALANASGAEQEELALKDAIESLIDYGEEELGIDPDSILEALWS